MRLAANEKIVVHYGDETIEEYTTIIGAQEGILETITGCDFAVNVDAVQVCDYRTGKEIRVLGCSWSLKLEEN